MLYFYSYMYVVVFKNWHTIAMLNILATEMKISTYIYVCIYCISGLILPSLKATACTHSYAYVVVACGKSIGLFVGIT